ncbi:STAS domain-containing protein [Streptomyces sp. NPDC001816]|uniref:STAS domain-containing protein n=1 Tax=Streptomyces sp. NPDC001816 TaxID=3364612 RepID=UPI0036C98E9E
MTLALKERRTKAGTVVTLTGEINSETSGTLLEQLRPLVRSGGTLRIDLKHVSYISSAGLRTLLVVYREAQHSGARVTLSGVGEEVRFVMSATGFLGFFDAGDGGQAAPAGQVAT